MSEPSSTSEHWARVFGGFTALAVLWIGVYWLWPTGTGVRGAGAGQRGVVPKAVAPDVPPTALSSRETGQPAGDPTRVAGDADARVAPSGTLPPTGTSPPLAAATKPEIRLVPPKFRAYVVKKNDTFQSIAQKELGSSTLWKAIAQSNPFVSPASLQPGREIKIPLDPANIQGKTEAAPAGEGEQPASKPTSPAPTEGEIKRAEAEHVVRSGDSLSKIARQHYGDSTLAWVIFDANKDRLRSEDELTIGQTLRIPPKPASPAKPER